MNNKIQAHSEKWPAIPAAIAGIINSPVPINVVDNCAIPDVSEMSFLSSSMRIDSSNVMRVIAKKLVASGYFVLCV